MQDEGNGTNNPIGRGGRRGLARPSGGQDNDLMTHSQEETLEVYGKEILPQFEHVAA